jgi:hypothetical protein
MKLFSPAKHWPTLTPRRIRAGNGREASFPPLYGPSGLASVLPSFRAVADVALAFPSGSKITQRLRPIRARRRHAAVALVSSANDKADQR